MIATSNLLLIPLQATSICYSQERILRCRMRCPSCQNDLVEIPTLEGPPLDVCPGRHGLWLDGGEVTLFVENDRAVEEVSGLAASEAIAPQSTTCPKCRGPLKGASVRATALFACRACHGWWLPNGSLTQLNATARGGAARSRVDETDFYRRAEKRVLQRHTSKAGCPARARSGPRPQDVWFWTVFLSVALLFSALIVVAGLRKIGAPSLPAMPPDRTGVWLVVGAIAGMGLSTYGFVLNNRIRLIESIPTSPVRSLAVGLVEVTGRAQPEQGPLRAPFSGMPCVFYSYAVEERRQSGKEARWETIAKGTSQEPFYVQDETGRVLVVPFDAELILPDHRTTRSNWFGALPAETIVGLSTMGIAVDGWFGGKTIRCSETMILPDEHVYVMGTAQEHRGASAHTDNSARLYIGSDRDHEFIITNRSEKALLSRLRWQLWASLGGGPVLVLFCLLLMFKLYGTVQ
jgi:Zn-finger nucleic acid-binding protein